MELAILTFPIWIVVITTMNFYISSNQATEPNWREFLQACILDKVDGNGLNSSQLFLKNDPEAISKYTELNYQWNQLGDQKLPFGYFIPEMVDDIQKILTCCKKFNVRIVPKCGGHSFAKYSFGDTNTLIIDLQKLDQVVINETRETCEVGPGTLIGHLAWKLRDQSKTVLPLGSCPTVGIGFTLGGGDGSLSRLHGLTMDNLIECEMIDSEGNLVTANNSHNTDLFWALRGAGTSFGIVTKYKFKLHKAPSFVNYGTRVYQLNAFKEVLEAWQSLFLGNPSNTLSGAIHLNKKGFVLLIFEFMHVVNQPSAEHNSNSNNLVQELFQNHFPTKNSTFSSIVKLEYSEFLLKSSLPNIYNLKEPKDLLKVTRTSTKPTYFKAKSFFVNDNIVNSEGIQLIYKELEQIPQNVGIDIYAAGGKSNEIKSNETAYVHRNAAYSIQIIYDSESNNNNTTAEEMSSTFNWMANFFNKTKLIMKHTESYQNYIDEDLEDYLTRYYGANLERLIEIKKKYDPKNYFWNPQSIPLLI